MDAMSRIFIFVSLTNQTSQIKLNLIWYSPKRERNNKKGKIENLEKDKKINHKKASNFIESPFTGRKERGVSSFASNWREILGKCWSKLKFGRDVASIFIISLWSCNLVNNRQIQRECVPKSTWSDSLRAWLFFYMVT